MARPALTPDAYAALRRRVLERDGWRCRNPLCRSQVQLDVDHVIPRSQGGADCLENLVTLNRRCHELKGQGLLVIIPDAAGGFRFHDLRRTLTCEACYCRIVAGTLVAAPTPSGGIRWVQAP